MTLVATPALRKLASSLVALAASCLALGCAASDAPSSSAPPDAFARTIADLESRGFNGLIALDQGGERRIVGVGEDFDGRPDLGSLQVDSGSITKTFTAAALLTFVDEGAIALDDTLKDFFPGAPADKADITIRQLLTLSSGLPGAVGGDDEMAGRDDLVRLAFASDLLFAPGDGYEYSNVSYSLIAAIMEQISGMTYEEILRARVFEPAGMTRSGYRSVFDDGHSMRTAEGATIAESSWNGFDAITWHLIGNGGVVTTADDMMAFMTAFADGRIVSPRLVADARAPHVREGDMPSHYGYGMVVEDHPAAGRMYWHNGGNPWFFAQWTDFAERDARLFVAAQNTGDIALMAPELVAAAIFPQEE